jgi:PAS domain S-box-containing protein
LKQTRLAGVLYLENNLSPHVFNPARIAVLQLLASQAAISLENTRLYRDLEEREAKIRRLVDANIVGIFIWNLAGEIIEANEAFLQMIGYSREDLLSGGLRWTDLTPRNWRDRDERAIAELQATGILQPIEKEYSRKGGDRVPVLIGAAFFEGSENEGVAFVLDLSERKRSEEELRRRETDLRKAQAELAYVTRVTTMGELAASIAHEVSQPIAAVITNGGSCLRWLAQMEEDSENLDEARKALQRIIRDGKRAGDVIARLRTLFKKAETPKEPLDLNEAIREVVDMTRSEMDKRGVRLRLDLAIELPPIVGDRVQLQQVMVNLILNAMEAMSIPEVQSRDLVIGTGVRAEAEILVTVRDSGPGLQPERMEQVFAPFHTTKPGGLGMGLSISRSIVENHAGRLWVNPNHGPGATFQFTIPVQQIA